MTEEEVREALARALIQFDDEDGPGMFEWHPCRVPACRARHDPPQPCPCAGAPYLSEDAWQAILPTLREIGVQF